MNFRRSGTKTHGIRDEKKLFRINLNSFLEG